MIKPSDEMVAAYKAARRAYWQALDWTTQGKTVAECEAEASRAGLAAVLALAYSADPHIYLSTGCLHGDHAYCQVEARRYDGSTKTAATCKFCASPCVCPCHGGSHAVEKAVDW